MTVARCGNQEKWHPKMHLLSVWPYFVVVAGCLLAVSIQPISRKLNRTLTDAGRRYASIDGLRGFLALSVFFSHAMTLHDFILTGVWQWPPSRFYTQLGQVGVALFFMITGFLFWGRLLSSRSIDWIGLYIGRISRIGPMYVITVGAMLIWVMRATDFRLAVPRLDFARQLFAWLALGLGGQGPFNGDSLRPLVLAGQTWSLFYEWCFYLSLPLLSLVAGRRRIWFIVAVLLLVSLSIPSASSYGRFYIALFACGMLTASAVRGKLLPTLQTNSICFAGVCSLIFVLTYFDTAYCWQSILLLGFFFCTIASGGSVFGILTASVSRRLGQISFSVYMTHPLVLNVLLRLPSIKAFAFGGPVHYWGFIALSAFVLMVVSTATYLVIEEHGIALGKYVAARVRAMRSPRYVQVNNR